MKQQKIYPMYFILKIKTLFMYYNIELMRNENYSFSSVICCRRATIRSALRWRAFCFRKRCISD